MKTGEAIFCQKITP